MTEQESINYKRIAEAINYIKLHFREQPDLDEVARIVHLSPFHFQRLFVDWAGVSPKKFLQYISLEYAKHALKTHNASLFDVAFEAGLSGSSRLHDLFISIEGMTPGEYKKGGENLEINFDFGDSPFGEIIVASTSKGICHLAFSEDKTAAFKVLEGFFPRANFRQLSDSIQQNALKVFQNEDYSLPEVKLHLKGSDFQLKVWEALLKIPLGRLSTYGDIAMKINNPSASRAVGSAIGSNPVAYLIPCHRVIQASGVIGGYMWGPTRKSAMIGWEAAKINSSI